MPDLEKIRRLREQAAQTAALCGDCYGSLRPKQIVTMQSRRVHIVSTRFGEHDIYLRVPICFSCSKDAHRDIYYSWEKKHRLRCEGCNRPILVISTREASDLFIGERVCCDDCEKIVRLRQDRERKRVHHVEKKCAECKKSFTPKRTDAETCSNRCRQARFRAGLRRGGRRAR
jgi:hypothetical protein